MKAIKINTYTLSGWRSIRMTQVSDNQYEPINPDDEPTVNDYELFYSLYTGPAMMLNDDTVVLQTPSGDQLAQIVEFFPNGLPE